MPSYRTVKAAIAAALETLIADAESSGCDVEHPHIGFQQRSNEESGVNTSSAGCRHFWMQGGSEDVGGLAVGAGVRHVVQILNLYVQYPANLRNLDTTYRLDSGLIAQRLEDTAYNGAGDAATGVLNIRHLGALPSTGATATTLNHTLRVEYLANVNARS